MTDGGSNGTVSKDDLFCVKEDTLAMFAGVATLAAEELVLGVWFMFIKDAGVAGAVGKYISLLCKYCDDDELDKAILCKSVGNFILPVNSGEGGTYSFFNCCCECISGLCR